MNRSSFIPSLFTLGNLLCGFGALAVVAHAPGGNWDREIVWAAWFIILAMVFDMLDGKVARLAHQTSDLGAELDSLCDVVSFGAAPGLIIYVIAYRIFHLPVTFALVLGGWFASATALRLARFNVGNSHDEESHQFFQGLPCPAAAGVVASLVILDRFLIEQHRLMGLSKHASSLALEIVPYVAVLAAILMVSSVPYIHVTNLLLKRRKPPELFLLGLVFTAFAIAKPEVTLFCVFGGYLLSGPMASAWRLWSADEELVGDEEEDEEALL